MGLFNWLKKTSLIEEDEDNDIENTRWVNVHIQITGSPQGIEKKIPVFQKYAKSSGMDIYSDELDTSKFGEQYKGYKILGIEPRGGLMSPKELSHNLLTLRRVAFWIENEDSPKSKGKVTLTFMQLDWRIINVENQNSKFVIFKYGLEINCDLNKVIQLHKKNPKLCEKAFYFSLNNIYKSYLKALKSKSKKDVENAKFVLDALEKNGYIGRGV